MGTLRQHDELLRRMRISFVGLAVLILAVLPEHGCQKEYCVEGLDLGTTYRVTVLEPADTNSQYGIQTSHGPDFGTSVDATLTCGAGFDFVSGSTFLIEPISKADFNDCYGRIAVPSEVAEIQLMSQTDAYTGGGYLMGTPRFQVDRGGGCVGQWQLTFSSPWDAHPLDVPVPGDYPPVVMVRTFYPEGGDVQPCLLPNSGLATHTYCIDYFVVKLDKT
jgi:hypothetical protein